MELGKKGIPTIVVCTDRFEALARMMLKNLGMPDIPLVITSHPVGGLQVDEVKAKAERLSEDIIKLIS